MISKDIFVVTTNEILICYIVYVLSKWSIARRCSKRTWQAVTFGLPLLAAIGLGVLTVQRNGIGNGEVIKVVGRDQMRAAIYDPSAPEGMRIDSEAALPSLPSQDSLLVKIHAAALNPVNVKLRLPTFPFARWFVPNVVATDFAGVVEHVPEGASEKCASFPSGSKIFGMTRSGAFQEYTTVRCDGPIALIPEGVSMEEAAGLGVVAITTYDGLISRHNVTKGDRLLVIGGSGGCGQMGIQMGKYLGAYVTTIASSRNSDLVRSLGADEVVDYTSSSFQSYQPDEKFDLIYDTVSSSTHGDPNYEPQASPWLAPYENATYVAINSATPSDWPRALLAMFFETQFAWGESMNSAWGVQREKYDLFLPRPSAEKFTHIAEMCQSGSVKVTVDSSHALSDTGLQDAVQRQDSRRATGKIIIVP